MTDALILKTIEKYLKENIAPKLKFKKPPEDNQIVDSEYELVNPAVFTGWVPPKNYNIEYGYDVPSIIAMIDEGIDDNDGSEVSVRLKIVTFDAGTVGEDNTLTPNTEGYKDLLTAMDFIRRELSQNPILQNKLSVKLPINRSMDEEQLYPYWSANINFSLDLAPFEFNIKENLYSKYI